MDRNLEGAGYAGRGSHFSIAANAANGDQSEFGVYIYTEEIEGKFLILKVLVQNGFSVEDWSTR